MNIYEQLKAWYVDEHAQNVLLLYGNVDTGKSTACMRLARDVPVKRIFMSKRNSILSFIRKLNESVHIDTLVAKKIRRVYVIDPFVCDDIIQDIADLVHNTDTYLILNTDRVSNDICLDDVNLTGVLKVCATIRDEASEASETESSSEVVFEASENSFHCNTSTCSQMSLKECEQMCYIDFYTRKNVDSDILKVEDSHHSKKGSGSFYTHEYDMRSHAKRSQVRSKLKKLTFNLNTSNI